MTRRMRRRRRRRRLVTSRYAPGYAGHLKSGDGMALSLIKAIIKFMFSAHALISILNSLMTNMRSKEIISILKFTKIRLSVCLFVCPIFSTPYRGPISNLITFLESLHHRGANKIICSPLKAEIKKKLACKLFFSSRNVFLYVTKFFLYVTYKSKCRSKNKFYSSM